MKINIEASDACNLHCSGCMRPPHGHMYMTVKTFTNILERVADNLPCVGTLFLHWRGESTLNPHLPDIAEAADDYGFRTYISANMTSPHLANRRYVEKLRKHLTWMTACVDGWNQETLGKYRVGADFDKLIRNMRMVGSVPANSPLQMRVLMFRHNEGHQDWFRQLARECNVNVIRWGKPIILNKMTLTQAEVDEWLADNPAYQRYTRQGNVWIHKTATICRPHICIGVDGTVSPCSVDWNQTHSLGNILNDDYSVIAENFRKVKPLMLKRSLDICKYCFCIRPANETYNVDERLK